MAAEEGARLAAVLAAGRRRLFVGRATEQDAFRQALRRDAAVLFAHGPGGIGKTTLLDVCADIARSEGRPSGEWTAETSNRRHQVCWQHSATKCSRAPCC